MCALVWKYLYLIINKLSTVHRLSLFLCRHFDVLANEKDVVPVGEAESGHPVYWN